MLEVLGLRRSFGETRALDGLDFDVARGAIVGIAGTNGAGKSTLVRILAGEDRADHGEMTLDGAPLSRGGRVAVVHQEPQLFRNLTVVENVLVGDEPGRWSRPRHADAHVLSVLDELDLSRFKDLLLGDLPLGVQQRVEIARAVVREASVYLFDEPNSALTEEESVQLFAWMHTLAERGAVVLLVTHRFGDLVAHASSVVVLRDGRVSVRLDEGFTQQDIARAMLPDEVRVLPENVERSLADGPDILRLSSWRGRHGAFSVPELELRSGEVVAVVGVEGSGGRELVASLAGFAPLARDAVLSSGGPLLANYLPASRTVSLFQDFSIAQNVVVRLGRGPVANRLGFTRSRRVRRLGDQARSAYAVASASSDQSVASLSGGNQQKVAIAATLLSEPRLVAVEEPTRGVDVGSRAEIHRVLRDYARAGSFVVVFCTETSEVFHLADRVHVMDQGSLSPSIRVADHTSSLSLAAALAVLQDHASPVSPSGTPSRRRVRSTPS